MCTFAHKQYAMARNPIKQLAGQTAVYGLGTVIPRLTNYLVMTPVLTRVFLEQEYGVVSYFYSIIAILMVLMTFGMETGYFRFVTKSGADKQSVFTTAAMPILATSVLFVLLTALLARPLASVLWQPGWAEYLRYSAIIVGMDAVMNVLFARLREENKAMRFALIKIVNVSVNVGLILFFLVLCPWLVINGHNWVSYIYEPSLGVAYVFIANIAASAVSMLLLLPEFAKLNPRSWDKGLFFKLMAYSAPLVAGQLAGTLNEFFDRILQKELLPGPDAMAQLGIYAANYRLAVIIVLFIQMFRYAAEPFFFARAEDKNSPKLYADIMKYFIIFSLAMALGIMMYIDVLKYFLGQAFHVGLHIVPILLLAKVLLGVQVNLSFWYKLIDKTMFGVYLMGLGAVVTITGNLILLPIMGYEGSAWTTLACYGSIVVASYLFSRRYNPFPYDLRSIALYFVAAAGLFGLSQLTKTGELIVDLATGTGYFLAYCALVAVKEKVHKTLRK